MDRNPNAKSVNTPAAARNHTYRGACFTSTVSTGSGSPNAVNRNGDALSSFDTST